MPLYEYSCKKCRRRFEALVSSARAKAPACPDCGAKTEKQFSTFAVGGGKEKASAFGAGGGCGSCGDPRGPGACGMN